MSAELASQTRVRCHVTDGTRLVRKQYAPVTVGNDETARGWANESREDEGGRGLPSTRRSSDRCSMRAMRIPPAYSCWPAVFTPMACFSTTAHHHPLDHHSRKHTGRRRLRRSWFGDPTAPLLHSWETTCPLGSRRLALRNTHLNPTAIRGL